MTNAKLKEYDLIIPLDQEPKFKPREPIVRIPPAPSGNVTKGEIEMKHAVMQADLAYMKQRLMDLDFDTDNRVHHEEFEPIRKLVFGLIATVLMAIMGALLSLTISS